MESGDTGQSHLQRIPTQTIRTIFEQVKGFSSQEREDILSHTTGRTRNKEDIKSNNTLGAQEPREPGAGRAQHDGCAA